MSRGKSYIGMRFGRLTVIGVDESNTTKNTKYICQCDCGNLTSVSRCNLKSGHIISCGCYNREKNRKHGMSHTRIFGIYKCMMHRCNSPKDHAYSEYGGRGIKVCKEWQDDFLNFYNWSMENGYSDDLSIDRIDNNGNYEPSNCRWATQIQQMNNTRYNNHVLYGGKRYTVSEFARMLGISVNTVYRYFDTERKIKEDKMFVNGSRKQYVSRKTAQDIIREKQANLIGIELELQNV